MKEIKYIHLNDLRVPIKLIPENRRSARAAFGKNSILLRIPRWSNSKEIDYHVQWAEDWLKKLFHKKPKVFERYRAVHYQTGKLISTAYKDYVIQLKKEERKTVSGKIDMNELYISIPIEMKDPTRKIGKIVSRLLAKDQLPWIESKVAQLNALHFKEEVKKVSLRNTATRWGSCSNNGNISLSTRILLAPEKIINHIIIHELAHLKEMNHSPSFWKWVKNAEPDHDRNDRWLKDNGYRLKF